MFHEISEHNGLKGTFHGVIFSFTSAPLAYALILEETHTLQLLDQWFRHLAFTPTCGHNGDRFLFNLGLVLLGSHLKVTSFGSGATRVAIGFWLRRGECESESDGGQEFKGQKPLEVFNRLYTVFGGNLVNIWDANGFFPSLLSFSGKFLVFAMSLHWFLNLNGGI